MESEGSLQLAQRSENQESGRRTFSVASAAIDGLDMEKASPSVSIRCLGLCAIVQSGEAAAYKKADASVGLFTLRFIVL